MSNLNRRSLLAGAIALGAAVAVSPALAATGPSLVPTEVYDWAQKRFVPLQGGLARIRRGLIFRQIVPDTDGRSLRIGIAVEDGSWSPEDNCGQVECEFHETLEDAQASVLGGEHDENCERLTRDRTVCDCSGRAALSA